LSLLPKIGYDLIAGTSAGAINACLLSVGYSYEDLIDFYSGEPTKTIFSPYNTIFHKSKYNSKNIEKVLLDKLGNAKLKDVKKDIMVTSYDINTRSTVLFTSLEESHKEYYLRDIARASSAAPYYFYPHAFDKYICIDGGLSINNPSLGACSLIVKKYGYEDIYIVSIGTGSFQVPLKSDDMCYINPIKFIANLIDCFMDGSSDATEEIALNVLKEKYIRFQPKIKQDNSALDNVSDKNIKSLEEIAKEYLINDCSKKLELLKKLY